MLQSLLVSLYYLLKDKYKKTIQKLIPLKYLFFMTSGQRFGETSHYRLHA